MSILVSSSFQINDRLGDEFFSHTWEEEDLAISESSGCCKTPMLIKNARCKISFAYDKNVMKWDHSLHSADEVTNPGKGE